MSIERLAITKYDDVTRHDQGCECELCDRLTSRSYGVGIFECDGRDEESIERAIWSNEPVERLYACSPDSARHNARMRLEELGYTFLADF